MRRPCCAVVNTAYATVSLTLQLLPEQAEEAPELLGRHGSRAKLLHSCGTDDTKPATSNYDLALAIDLV